MKVILGNQDKERYKKLAENILREMVEVFYDTYECSDEPCECCGDYVETYTMKV